MRHRVIVKKVYYGNELTEEDLEPREKARRAQKKVDGWIDGGNNLRIGIPVAKRASGDFYVGDRTGRPEIMDRAWAEGDERHGLKIVENDLGTPTIATWSWSEEVGFGEEGDLEWEGDTGVTYLIVDMKARAKQASGTQIGLWVKNSNGAYVSDDAVAMLTFSSPRGVTGFIGEVLKPGHSISPWLEDLGGARNLVLNVTLREML